MGDTRTSSATMFSFESLFSRHQEIDTQRTIKSGQFCRTHYDMPGKATLILDSFPETAEASCCFIRLIPGKSRHVRFLAHGISRIEAFPSGGWLLKAADTTQPCYWIPQPPVSRRIDPQQRILSEETVAISDFSVSSNELSVEFTIPENMNMDWVIWCFPAENSDMLTALTQLLVLERQPLSLWNSQTRYQSPADIYLYLVHGHVYVNRFIWPRMWKICSELDAYGLYVAVSGLELATGKLIYKLLKSQLLFSVISRQADDGGWYHGEWTDLMESHYRFHNGAMLLLEAAQQEQPDETIGKALKRGAQFISRCTDDTDMGLWFLHDSLEESADMMKALCKQTGSTWIPARTLGKSPTNKLILNTHLDTIVVLEQYSNITGDNRYSDIISSALAAARSILALHPAEYIYRIAYRAIQLTLLPKKEAERLPFFIRIIKRLTWKYLTPQMHRLKRAYPRLVMPGGLIERHLSMPHYDINYHSVNILDLSRLWRCFPDEDFNEILANAIEAVADSSMLEYWAEEKPRHFSLVVWVEAVYHICTLRQDSSYRKILAEGIIKLIDAGLGLPPLLLGADCEAVRIEDRIACPSPTDNQLRIANLSCNGDTELLIINATKTDRNLVWEDGNCPRVSLVTADGQSVTAGTSPLRIASRQWIWGKKR